jgi:hypothetical protein
MHGTHATSAQASAVADACAPKHSKGRAACRVSPRGVLRPVRCVRGEQGRAKAAAAAELRAANEEAVAPGRPADQDLLAAYVAYVKLEEAHGDPARVQVRA